MEFAVEDRIVVNYPANIFYDGKIAVVDRVIDDYAAVGGKVVYKVRVDNVEFMLTAERMEAA